VAIEPRARLEVDVVKLAGDRDRAFGNERRARPEVDQLVGGLGVGRAESLGSGHEMVVRLAGEQRAVDEEAALSWFQELGMVAERRRNGRR